MLDGWSVAKAATKDDALWTTHGLVFASDAETCEDERLMRLLAERGATLLVALRDARPVARCLVGLHEGSEKGLYFAGFFASEGDGESRVQSYDALLTAAKEHVIARADGRALVAPVNAHSWLAYRLREDDHPKTYPWEPRRDSDLRLALNAAGFKEHLKYWSRGSRGLEKVFAHCAPFYHTAIQQRFRFVPFKEYRGAKSEELFKAIWRLTHAAFEKSPLFASIPYEDYRAFQGRSHDATPMDLGRVLISPEGEIIGYMWNFFDADRTTLVFKTLAIDPRYHGQRLADAILYEPVREALHHGSKDYISALVLRGNKSEFIARHGETMWEHQYSTWIWQCR